MGLTPPPRHDGPAWTIIDRGHTERGWPWFVVRKRGGQVVRVTVHPEQAADERIVEAIDATVERVAPRPGPDVY